MRYIVSRMALNTRMQEGHDAGLGEELVRAACDSHVDQVVASIIEVEMVSRSSM